jgi:CcmD family protein
MKNLFNKIATLVFLLTPFIANAQDVEMADKFRADGKIYVVIIVFSIILTGLFVYLFSLDRKIGKLEEQNKK